MIMLLWYLVLSAQIHVNILCCFTSHVISIVHSVSFHHYADNLETRQDFEADVEFA